MQDSSTADKAVFETSIPNHRIIFPSKQINRMGPDSSTDTSLPADASRAVWR
jgi:hypothetical protein